MIAFLLWNQFIDCQKDPDICEELQKKGRFDGPQANSWMSSLAYTNGHQWYWFVNKEMEFNETDVFRKYREKSDYMRFYSELRNGINHFTNEYSIKVSLHLHIISIFETFY